MHVRVFSYACICICRIFATTWYLTMYLPSFCQNSMYCFGNYKTLINAHLKMTFGLYALCLSKQAETNITIYRRDDTHTYAHRRIRMYVCTYIDTNVCTYFRFVATLRCYSFLFGQGYQYNCKAYIWILYIHTYAAWMHIYLQTHIFANACVYLW